MDKQLKPVNLRLGITDGTNTELLSGELQPNVEVVTERDHDAARPPVRRRAAPAAIR